MTRPPYHRNRMAQNVTLALEFSGKVGSVAAALADGPIHERTLATIGRHSAEAPAACADLLASLGVAMRDVSLCAFSQGPGSFTGLRVAATMARMLAFSNHARIVAVPTLELLALHAQECAALPPRTAIAAVRPARPDRVFAAIYAFSDDSGMQELLAAREYPLIEFLAALPPACCVTGDALELHAARFTQAGAVCLDSELWRPGAARVLSAARERARRGAFCDPADASPLYLRPPECEEVYETRRAAAIARRTEAAP